MKQLNEELRHMQTTAELLAQNSDLLPTLQHGSMNADGKPIIQPEHKVKFHRPPQANISPRVNDLPQNTKLKLNTPTGKAWLAQALSQLMVLLRVYGKTSSELETMVEGFAEFMGEISLDEFQSAFRKYVLTSNQMPTPYDINQILNPPPPVLSAAMYTAIKKRSADGEKIYGSELDFIHAFEAQELAKVK